MAEGIKEKVIGKLTRKASKGFQIEGDAGWFNVTDAGKPYLDKLNVGDNVEIEYVKKGINRIVFKTTPVKETPKVTAPETTNSTGFVCEDCGKELKDGKYKKCFMCNKKNPPKTQVIDEEPEKAKKEWTPGNYNNPEKTAQIQRGNALNAAASVMSNPNLQVTDSTPEGLAEVTKIVAQLFLDWLRVE